MTYSYVQAWYDNLLYRTAHNPLYETTHIASSIIMASNRSSSAASLRELMFDAVVKFMFMLHATIIIHAHKNIHRREWERKEGIMKAKGVSRMRMNQMMTLMGSAQPL